jgi:hypothetical protein
MCFRKRGGWSRASGPRGTFLRTAGPENLCLRHAGTNNNGGDRPMTLNAIRRTLFLLALATAGLAGPAGAWELSGTKSITMYSREGEAVPIGTIEFHPEGKRVGFTLHMDHGKFKDYFLSMKEFKCLEGSGEIACHVPYPDKHPATIDGADFAWLEHSLLFMFKQPSDYGAKLWNGLYFRMQRTDTGLVGTPEAVDLSLIGAPPDDLTVPPFGKYERTKIDPATRWFNRITIQ